MVVKEEGVGEDRSWGLGLADANSYLQNGINSKVQLYSTGNYIRHRVIKPIMGKNMKNNVYLCMTESLCYIAVITTAL